LLPPCGWEFWFALPTLLVELLEFEPVPVDVDDDESSSELVVVDEPVDDVPDVVPDVVVFDCASAVCTTPEMSPTVSAPAAALAMTPATPAVVRSFRPFMASTIAAGGSARPHNNVKAFSRLAGSRFRARAFPA
jgi:hypothetical protein